MILSLETAIRIQQVFGFSFAVLFSINTTNGFSEVFGYYGKFIQLSTFSLAILGIITSLCQLHGLL